MYNFLNDRKRYINRCVKEIALMPDDFLIDLSTVCFANMDAFRSKWKLEKNQFNKADVHNIARFKKLLKILIKKHVVNNTEDNARMMAGFMAKRYILKNNTGIHVTCRIFVGDDYEMRINRYNIQRNDNLLFTFVSGCIEHNESVRDTLLREMAEEVNFKFDFSQYKNVSSSDKAHNFELQLSYKEYEHYVRNFNPSNLDPEITAIALFNVASID